jgi:hypothetical protein
MNVLMLLCIVCVSASTIRISQYTDSDCNGKVFKSRDILNNECIKNGDRLKNGRRDNTHTIKRRKEDRSFGGFNDDDDDGEPSDVVFVQFTTDCLTYVAITPHNLNTCEDQIYWGVYTSLNLCIGEDGEYIKFTCIKSCFSKDSNIYFENGTTSTIDLVQPGDKVLSVNEMQIPFYDTVFRIGHYDPDTITDFIQLTTETNEVIELSNNHYLHVNQCCNVEKMTLASNVVAGSTVFTTFPSILSKLVTNVTKVTKRGAYNVHVLSGTIVVNGIIASHFTTESEWSNNKLALIWYNLISIF